MATSQSRRGWNTLYVWSRPDLSLKWRGCLNHNLTPATSQTPTDSHCHHCECETQHISAWNCLHMTTGHNRRWWNALYMYEEDLLWVWTGWGQSIITYSMTQVRNQVKVNLLLPPLCSVSARPSIYCIHMTTGHYTIDNRRCWNTLYMYEEDLLWVWSGWGASIITHSMTQVRNQENLLLPPLWVQDPAYIASNDHRPQ